MAHSDTLHDPVCGMTVGPDALRIDGYEGIGFCCPGCRTTFTADPESFKTLSRADEQATDDRRHDDH